MTVMGVRILYTHGHTFYVKSTVEILRSYAAEGGYDVVLYGHTHQPDYLYSRGIHYLNPGSAVYAGRYRFGIVDITPSGIVCAATEIPAKTRGK